jgi:hypothetical protein
VTSHTRVPGRHRRTPTLVLLAGLLALLPGVATAKSYHAERFDVTISVLPDGSLQVVEEVEFRFEGGPFREIFRTIPLRGTDGIEDVVVTPLAAAGDPAAAPGLSDVERRRRELRISWRFPEASDTSRALRLSYRVLGAVAHDDEDAVLRWAVLPRRHAYRIVQSTVELVTAVPMTGEPDVRAVRMPDPQVEADGQRVVLLARDVRRHGYAELTVRFPGARATLPMPGWQQRDARHAARAPAFVSAALVLFAAGLALLGLVWLQAPRNAGGPPPADSTTSPPDDLPLLLAGALGNAGAEPRMLHVLAALLDLARRGFVEVAEAPRSSRLSGRAFILRVPTSSPPAHEHERQLLEVVRRDHPAGTTDIRFTDARKRLAKHWSSLRDEVRRELLAGRFIDENRTRARRRLSALAWVLFGLGVPGSVAAAAFVGTHGPAALLPGAGFALAGLVGLVAAESMPVLSEHGHRELARWKGFEQGVRDLARGRRVVSDPEPLERLLPWAVAFGVGPALFKRLRAKDTPLPGWFHPAVTRPEESRAAFASFLSTHASTSGAAGGASGAGGGGASGAR